MRPGGAPREAGTARVDADRLVRRLARRAEPDQVRGRAAGHEHALPLRRQPEQLREPAHAEMSSRPLKACRQVRRGPATAAATTAAAPTVVGCDLTQPQKPGAPTRLPYGMTTSASSSSTASSPRPVLRQRHVEPRQVVGAVERGAVGRVEAVEALERGRDPLRAPRPGARSRPRRAGVRRLRARAHATAGRRAGGRASGQVAAAAGQEGLAPGLVDRERLLPGRASRRPTTCLPGSRSL